MVVLLIVLGVIAVLLLLGGLYAYLQAFYAGGSKKNISGYFENNESFKNAKDNIKAMSADIDNCPSEDVYIKSYDGISLFAKYYHIKDGAPPSNTYARV